MWKLLITHNFITQFLKLEKGQHTFILDSLAFLVDTLNLKASPDLEIIDEYNDGEPSGTPFPITHHIDYDNERLYLISIEKHLIKSK